MSHSIIIYPNGMVEVTAGYDEVDEPVAYGVENTEDDSDPVSDALDVLYALDVSDALDVLDEHFANHGGIRVHLQVIRAVHNRQVWGADVTCKAADPGV